jgi:glutathione S-transferase
MPQNPMLRAAARIAMDFCTFKFIPAFYRLLINKEGTNELKTQFLAVLREIDARLREAAPSGPFWFGEQFTLVDISFVPFIDR